MVELLLSNGRVCCWFGSIFVLLSMVLCGKKKRLSEVEGDKKYVGSRCVGDGS